MRGLEEASLGEDDPLKPFSERPPLRRRVLLLALLLGIVATLLIVQGFDPSSSTRRFLELLLRDVQDPHWGVLYVLLAFAAGALVFAPITALFVATSLALSPLYGFLYCLLGGLFGGSLAYGAGRLLGARPLARFRGPHLLRLSREVGERPLRSVLIARFLPVGNFTLINLLLGSLRVPYWAFALGSLLGMTPGALGITLCKGLLERVLKAPSFANIALLVAGLLIVIGTLYVVARVLARRRRRRMELADAEAQALQVDLTQ
jgi:uncharacterized membrane protein YdjX (TVP38/TMEM64 family)